MNKKTRDAVYPQLVMRDGERCKMCGRMPDTTGTLQVDHILPGIAITKHNIGNAQLLCGSCNSRKNPRGKSKFHKNQHEKGSPYVCIGASESVEERERTGRMSAEMLKNRKAEPAWRLWLIRKVEKEKRVLVDDAINEGAEYAGCSIRTVPTYLKKITSNAGCLMIVKDEQTGVDYVVKREPEVESTVPVNNPISADAGSTENKK